jgi:predicted restriction endonuclease
MDYSTPNPKEPRIADTDFNAQIRRRDKVCLVGLMRQDGTCSEGVDCHHIETRGSGGDDVEENGITLCRHHHNEAHAGHISVEDLHYILGYYYGHRLPGTFNPFSYYKENTTTLRGKA